MQAVRTLVCTAQTTGRFITPICIQEHRSYSCLTSTALFGNAYHRQRQPTVAHSVASPRFASTSGVSTDMPVSSLFTGLWQTLSNSTPVAYVQQALIEIHDVTGLPWWGTIVVSTVAFRTLITLPLAIYQHKIAARIEQIMLEMPALVEELKREATMAMKKFKWSEKQTRSIYNHSLKKQWNNLIIRENCHPAKTLIVLWGQIPLWICQSVALRNLVHMLPDPSAFEAQLAFTELTVGGFGWIPNLTEVDSSYILPVGLGLLNLGIIELQSMLRTRPPTRLQTIATNAFRVLSVAMVPVAWSVPSALCVYWVSSSSYGLAQNLLLISPKFRRAVGIPKTNSELENPYEHLWAKIKIRTGQLEAKTPTATVVAKSEIPTASRNSRDKSGKS